MCCEEFIASYTEYCDGRLSAEMRDRFEKHIDACDSCRRYRNVLDRGVAMWRALPAASASPDFLPRLQHRLYHLDDAGKLSPRQHLGSAALVAVASVGFLAMSWLAFATRIAVEVELPPMAAKAPAALVADRSPSLFDEGPYVEQRNRFYVPARPHLDGEAGFFTIHEWSVPADLARPAVERRNGQLDEGR